MADENAIDCAGLVFVNPKTGEASQDGDTVLGWIENGTTVCVLELKWHLEPKKPKEEGERGNGG